MPLGPLDQFGELFEEGKALRRLLDEDVAQVGVVLLPAQIAEAPSVLSARVTTGFDTRSRAASPRTVCGPGSR